jgi:hypothetical protein
MPPYASRVSSVGLRVSSGGLFKSINPKGKIKGDNMKPVIYVALGVGIGVGATLGTQQLLKQKKADRLKDEAKRTVEAVVAGFEAVKTKYEQLEREDIEALKQDEGCPKINTEDPKDHNETT